MEKTNKYFAGSLLVCLLIITLLTTSNRADYLLRSSDTAPLFKGDIGQHVSFIEEKKSPSQCLSMDFNGTMDEVLSNHQQVFITMPPKAAGSTMKTFVQKCMKDKRDFTSTNFINDEQSREDFLTDQYHINSLIYSHMQVDSTWVYLSRHSNRQTLHIYLHRDETDRIVSASKQVLLEVCNLKREFANSRDTTKKFNLFRNETHCIVDEIPVTMLIKHRTYELRDPSLSCDTYKALEENDPNMIFMHFTKADELQKLLAKHHCPELLDVPAIHNNVEGEKSLKIFLRLKNNDEKDVVEIHEWLKEKKNILEWSLNLRAEESCQGKTKHMEDMLFDCPDQAIKASYETVKKW